MLDRDHEVSRGNSCRSGMTETGIGVTGVRAEPSSALPPLEPGERPATSPKTATDQFLQTDGSKETRPAWNRRVGRRKRRGASEVLGHLGQKRLFKRGRRTRRTSDMAVRTRSPLLQTLQWIRTFLAPGAIGSMWRSGCCKASMHVDAGMRSRNTSDPSPDPLPAPRPQPP